MLAIISEESLGCSKLNEFGLQTESLANGLLGQSVSKLVTSPDFQSESQTAIERDYPALRQALLQLENAAWIMPILDRSISIARRRQESSASTLDVVLAMVELEGPAREALQKHGLTADAILQQLGAESGDQTGNTLPVDEEFQLKSDEPETPVHKRSRQAVEQSVNSETRRIPALLDANLNRCREGLRVLDDYSRFIIRSEHATKQLKQLRHSLVTAEKLLHKTLPDLIAYRDVNADVGTQITTASELDRSGLTDLVAANSRRVQEALRSLEEFGKLYSAEFCTAIKAIRYESYALHQNLSNQQPATLRLEPELTNSDRTKRLAAANLYVLLTESLCRLSWKKVAEACLAGGADIIQLREKSLPARELVSRAKWISAACRESNALFIMNDRPDLAVLADADGIHVGQDDLTPTAVRNIVGPARLIGLSTHCASQIADANSCIDVDYLGVGPVFPSTTKSFEEFPGLQLVGKAGHSSTKPWFSIGGINQSNIQALAEAGATRAAICGAVIGSDSPEQAARDLRTVLSDMQTQNTMTADTEPAAQ